MRERILTDLPRDRLMNADANETATACMGVIDALQSRRREIQVTGLATAFAMACERFGVKPGEALGVADNIMHSGVTKLPEFRACEMYMRNEWK